MTLYAEKSLGNLQRNLRVLCEGRHEEIATKAKMHRVQLSRIINGRSAPSLATALNLASVLGVPLEELISPELPVALK